MSRKHNEADALATLLAFQSPLPTVLRAVWYAEGMEDDSGARRRGLNVVFTSRPGRGKSSRIRSISRGMGLHCETVIGSVREPADLIGLPVPGAGGMVTYAPPAWAVKCDEAGHAVVFLDELNRAVPAVQNAMLRVVLEGVAGDLQLPPDVRFVAAQNPGGSAGAWDLGDALANRFLHLDWPASDVRGWGSWMLGARTDGAEAGFDPAEETLRVDGLWSSAYARAAGLTTAFVARNPGCFEEELDEGDPRLSGPWASARTWEMATRALAAAFVYGLPVADGDALVCAAVGPAVARSFASWRSNADIPDPASVLDGDEKFAHNPARLDRTLAFMASVGALLVGERCTRTAGGKAEDARKPRAQVAFTLAHELATTGGAAEATVLFGQALMDAVRHRPLFMGTPGYTKMMAAVDPITRATNLGGGR